MPHRVTGARLPAVKMLHSTPAGTLGLALPLWGSALDDRASSLAKNEEPAAEGARTRGGLDLHPRDLARFPLLLADRELFILKCLNLPAARLSCCRLTTHIARSHHLIFASLDAACLLQHV